MTDASTSPAAPTSGENHPGSPGFVERRRRPTRALSRYSLFGGRRRGLGSPERSRDSYVDRYRPRLVALILVFFALTVFDAIATVWFIDHARGAEWNPIADWMLRQGRVFFVFAKGVPTALMLLFVMIHKNFVYGRIALAIGFGFYLALGVYHVVLQVMALLYEARIIEV